MLPEEDFRRACGHFVTGVCVLTACTPDGVPHGLTVNSFSSLSLDPPLVMAAIAHSSNQLMGFDRSEYFAVNILCEHQRHLSLHFSKRQDGRFNGIGWKPGQTGAPVFEEVLGVIECRAMHKFDAGDHRVLVGEAVAAHVHEGRPLLFFQSTYASLR